jgi:hypothetical protein
MLVLNDVRNKMVLRLAAVIKNNNHIRKLQRNLFLETLKKIWWRHRNHGA